MEQNIDTWYLLDEPKHMQAEWPRPGLYRARLVKGGCDVAVAIFVPCPMDPETCEPMDRSRQLTALVNGKWEFDPGHIYVSCLIGGTITAKQYQFLIDDRAWAAKFAPHLPEADPWRAVVVDKPKPGEKRDPKKDIDINDIDPVF